MREDGIFETNTKSFPGI